jgi:putative transcriptional regulator
MHPILRELREKNGLTVTDMAVKVGICRSFYWQIENGKRGLSYEMAKNRSYSY